MKKIIFIIHLCLITNVSFATSETTSVYLKCKKIVTQNKSTEKFGNLFAVGNFGQIVLTKIRSGKNKSNTKMTVYEPFPDFENYKDSFNQKIEDPIIRKQKIKVKNNSYSGVDKFSPKTANGKKSRINRYTFTDDNNNWSLKNNYLFIDEANGININYVAEGKCVLVKEAYYLNIIKKGPSQSDYNF